MFTINKLKFNWHQYLRQLKYNNESCTQILDCLLESQYWTDQQKNEYQLNALNELLRTASNSAPYYKKTFSNIPLPLKNIDEFKQKIPILEKIIIQKQPNQLKTEKFTSNFKHMTSGSTGHPVTIYSSGLAEVFRDAAKFRFLKSWGIEPHDKQLYIWGKLATSKLNKLICGLKNNMRLRHDINVFELNEQTIIRHYNDIKKFKPVYIRGFKSAILQLAELLEEKKITFDNFKLKLIVSTAEMLYEDERKFIEKIFGCKVVNEYGSSETGHIAFECPNGSMHIVEESVYIYTDENDDVYITELHNDSMPLINYKNNDKVVISDTKCSCGRTSRIISKIEGRDDDILLKPNGEKMDHFILIYIILELKEIGLDNCIEKFKIIQNKNNFSYFIVPTEKYNVKVEDYIRSRLLKEIGIEINIEFILVDSIPRDKSGKFRMFSRVE